MARKKRDYKAEYAARKRRATRAGYKSIREYSRARKNLNLPPRTSPVPKRIAERINPSVVDSDLDRFMRRVRRESKAWSDAHSHTHRSRYRADFTDEQAIQYYHTFVEDITFGSRKARGRERRKRLKDWLVPEFMEGDEWASKYQPV